MSPPSFSKCSDPGARVHAPLTLSDTWTCPGTSYCENHPTSRSPPAPGRVSVRVLVRTRAPVAKAAPGTKVGVVARAMAGARRTATAAIITARRAAYRAEGKSFTVIYSFANARWAEPRARCDVAQCRGEVAFR